MILHIILAVLVVIIPQPVAGHTSDDVMASQSLSDSILRSVIGCEKGTLINSCQGTTGTQVQVHNRYTGCPTSQQS